MILKCKVHGVKLIIRGTVRTIALPPGSFGHNCRLLTEFAPKEGQIGKCEIVKEQEG